MCIRIYHNYKKPVFSVKTFYKVFCLVDGKLCSPFSMIPFFYSEGVNYATRSNDNQWGFHCFLNKEDAVKLAKSLMRLKHIVTDWERCVVVDVLINGDDILFYGECENVDSSVEWAECITASSLYIYEKDYNEATK